MTDRMPMTGPGYDYPVPLRTLNIGDRFVSYSDGVWGMPDTIEYGTVLWIGQGSVELWWDHESKSGRCQPDLPVYKLDEQPLTADLIEHWYAQNTIPQPATERDENNPMANDNTTVATPAVNPTVKALIARYNFQLQSLQTALEGDDKAKASICMTRIQKAIMEARHLHLALPPTPPALAAYEPLLELLTDDDAQRKAEAVERENAARRKADNTDKQIARDVAKEKHITEVKGGGAGRVAPERVNKPKAERKLRPCLDGCGMMVAGNFGPGHDAKLKSLLIKIERGDLGLDAIPEPCLDLVKIVKGEAIQDRDSGGNPKGEPKQTYVITAAPVRFPGRDDIALTRRDDD